MTKRLYHFTCENNMVAFDWRAADLDEALEEIAKWHESDNIEDTHVIEVWSSRETIIEYNQELDDWIEVELPADNWFNPNY